MKKALIACFLLFSIAHLSFAQIPKVGGSGNAGKLLTQFVNAIKPTSFTDEWAGQKSGFLGSVGKISSAAGFASSISSLAGFIKPGMFKSGFNVQTLLNAANTVKTIKDASGLLKSFEGGLKPEAFVSGWAQKRSGWLSALNLLK